MESQITEFVLKIIYIKKLDGDGKQYNMDALVFSIPPYELDCIHLFLLDAD